jgi:hypothetical protein
MSGLSWPVWVGASRRGDPGSATLSSSERRDNLLAIPPLLEVVSRGIPDGDLAAAVLASGNRSLDRAVFERGPSLCTTRWFFFGSVDTPFGSAQLTSTPSCSSRKSKWRRRA